MSAITNEDLNLSLYPNLAKWPKGLEAKVGKFGTIDVSKSLSKTEYYSVEHNYDEATRCPCKNHVEGHRFCKHMEVVKYILKQRKDRLARKAAAKQKPVTMPLPVTIDPVEQKMQAASLNRSNGGGFSIFRR